MPIHLYHFTSRAAANAVLSEGFAGSTCWLSPDIETIVGDFARGALLEVELNLSPDELRPFERTVTEGEVWSDEVGDFAKDEEFAPTYQWYEVPAAVIAAVGTIRLVPNAERERLARREGVDSDNACHDSRGDRDRTEHNRGGRRAERTAGSVDADTQG